MQLSAASEPLLRVTADGESPPGNAPHWRVWTALPLSAMRAPTRPGPGASATMCGGEAAARAAFGVAPGHGFGMFASAAVSLILDDTNCTVKL